MAETINLSVVNSDAIYQSNVNDPDDAVTTEAGTFILEYEQNGESEHGWLTPVFIVARRAEDGARFLATYMQVDNDECDGGWLNYDETGGLVPWERVARRETTKVVVDYIPWTEENNRSGYSAIEAAKRSVASEVEAIEESVKRVSK